jgi:hypothetical protein
MQDAARYRGSVTRGHIQILSRQKLEATVCECYGVVRDEFERLLESKFFFHARPDLLLNAMSPYYLFYTTRQTKLRAVRLRILSSS